MLESRPRDHWCMECQYFLTDIREHIADSECRTETFRIRDSKTRQLGALLSVEAWTASQADASADTCSAFSSASIASGSGSSSSLLVRSADSLLSAHAYVSVSASNSVAVSVSADISASASASSRCD